MECGKKEWLSRGELYISLSAKGRIRLRRKRNMVNTTIALIPAYEPTPELVNLAQALSRGGFTVVVVNDGSRSEYLPTFR